MTTSAQPPACPASVVVLSYNTRDLTLACLARFVPDLSPAGWQIIVVDNASADGTVAAVRRAFPGVEVIAAAANRGYAAGNNLGLTAARGEVIILLNSDVIVTPATLTALVDRLAQQPDVGAISAGLRTPSGAAQAHAFGRDPTLGVLLRRNLARLWGRREPEQWDVDHPITVDWVSGACLAVHAAAITQAGLLDERFFLYFEDVDWCRRLRAAGWRVVYDPTVTVTHLGGASQTQTIGGSPHYNRSLIAYTRKHHGALQAALTAGLLAVYALLLRRSKRT
jgi:GT2 family glycosyltransferase